MKLSDTQNFAALIEEVKRLKHERERLIHELWLRERRPSATIGLVLFLFGIVVMILSITFSSDIMAFVGLGLTFVGVISIYVRPARYVQATSLEHIASTLLIMADRVLRAFDVKGKGVYLPPLLIKDLKDGIVFVNSGSSINVPQLGELAEGKVLTDNPKGVCLTAAGLGLTNLLEEKLGRSFTQVSLEYLMEKLPELFTDVLEIADLFEIRSSEDLVFVKAKDAIFFSFCGKTRKSLDICSSYGCPFCSSIAVALARCLGKPILIQNSNLFPKDDTVEIVYRVINA